MVPFLVQFGQYVAPVSFISSIVPEQWWLLCSLNPMAGVIEGFRWAITGKESLIYWPGYLMSIVLITVILISGFWWFRRMERSFADVI